MSDETTTTNENPNQPAANPSTETKNPNPPTEHMIPKHRFDEVNEKLQKLQADADKAAKEAAKAEEERLAKEKQWEDLAEQRKTRIAELEPAHAALSERTTKLEAMISAQLEAEIKEWPDEVKALDPGKDADLLVRLDWLNRSRALAEKLSGQPPIPGNGRRPAPVAQAGKHQNDQSVRTAHERWGHSQF